MLVEPAVVGLYLLSALAGEVVMGTIIEVVYLAFIRPSQTAKCNLPLPETEYTRPGNL
jgi:hypothetical protein